MTLELAVGRRARRRRRRLGTAVTAVSVASALTLAACGSSSPSGSSSTTSSSAPPATSAQSSAGNTASAPGVTPTSITVGQLADISEPVPGLFKSAQVGAQAYFAYINSLGGVNGRKIVLDSRDTQFNPAIIKTDSQQMAQNDFAFVGNYTLFDVAAQPAIDAGSVPNVGVPIGFALANDKNTYSPVPSTDDEAVLGPFEWFKQHDFDATQHAAVLYAAATPSAQQAFTVLQQVFGKLGYKLVYSRGFQANETTFESDVLKMKAAGVKFFWFDGPDNYAATIAREFSQQNFSPIDYETAGYGSNLLKLSGGTANGMYLPLQTAMFLGQDATAVPIVRTFDTWMKKIDPVDSIASWGATSWSAAALFVQALRNAGKNPTRASLVAALNQITNFDADGMVAPADPAHNVPSQCWLLAQVKNNQIQRVPPSPKSGYACSPGGLLPINGYTPSTR